MIFGKEKNMKDKYEEERRAVKKNVNSCGNLEIVKLKLENENLKLKLQNPIENNLQAVNKKLDDILVLLTEKINNTTNQNTTNNFGEHLTTLGPYIFLQIFR